MSAGEHWLIVTAEAEDRDAEYSLECGGVTERCRTWAECEHCDVTEDEREEGEGESHGVWHQILGGYWMVETDQCVLHACEAGDSASDLMLGGSSTGGPLPSGRYPIEIDDVEEGYVSLLLKREVTAA